MTSSLCTRHISRSFLVVYSSETGSLDSRSSALCKKTFTSWSSCPCISAGGMCERWAPHEVCLPARLPLRTGALRGKRKSKDLRGKVTNSHSYIFSILEKLYDLNSTTIATPLSHCDRPESLAGPGQNLLLIRGREWQSGRVEGVPRAGNLIILLLAAPVSSHRVSDLFKTTREAFTD